MTVESWEEEDVFFPSRCKMFLSSWYLHHFWGPPGFLVYGKWGPFCYKDRHMKLTTDVYLLPSLRVHLHFPMSHNCYGKDHRDSFVFALCLGFSSLFCPLLCFLFHVYSLFITLYCVLHLPLIGPSTLAIEVAPSSLYPHKWPTSLNMHSVCCLLYIFLHFTEHLIFGPRQLFLWRLQFWSCGRNILSMCNLSVLLLCVFVYFIIIWFLFLQIPFYPVVKKDLTFIHLGNDSKIEGLINFEKLRMIAKEVRTLTNMCSSPYDLLTMLGLGKRHIFLFNSVVLQLQEIG